jgi:argininosuccinate lyase
LIRGKAGRAIGRATGWLATMKGLPSGYNKDLQEDKEAVFDAEDTLAGSAASAATVVRTLALHEGPAARAAAGLLLATDVADYLVGRGVPFREAHEIVGGLVRRLVQDGREFADLTPEQWRRADARFGDDVGRVITAAASVAAKRTPQSTHPAAVARALAEQQDWLARQPG